jgi:hypothetical protein
MRPRRGCRASWGRRWRPATGVREGRGRALRAVCRSGDEGSSDRSPVTPAAPTDDSRVDCTREAHEVSAHAGWGRTRGCPSVLSMCPPGQTGQARSETPAGVRPGAPRRRGVDAAGGAGRRPSGRRAPARLHTVDRTAGGVDMGAAAALVVAGSDPHRRVPDGVRAIRRRCEAAGDPSELECAPRRGAPGAAVGCSHAPVNPRCRRRSQAADYRQFNERTIGETHVSVERGSVDPVRRWPLPPPFVVSYRRRLRGGV